MIMEIRIPIPIFLVLLTPVTATLDWNRGWRWIRRVPRVWASQAIHHFFQDLHFAELGRSYQQYAVAAPHLLWVRQCDHPVVGLFVFRGLVHLHQRVRHHWEEEFILAGLTVQALGRDWHERISCAAHCDWIQRMQTNLDNYETENFWV